jgi:hypothetical protein
VYFDIRTIAAQSHEPTKYRNPARGVAGVGGVGVHCLFWIRISHGHGLVGWEPISKRNLPTLRGSTISLGQLFWPSAQARGYAVALG